MAPRFHHALLSKMTILSIDETGVSRDEAQKQFKRLQSKKCLQIQAARQAAHEALDQALNFIEDHDLDNRDGWKLDVQGDKVTIHYKDIAGVRYFAARSIIPLPALEGHRFNWDCIGTVADWHENIRYSRVIKEVAPDFDIVHYATEDKGPVKSRDFVVGRKQYMADDVYIIAARSCQINAVPPKDDAVRGVLRLAFGRYKDLGDGTARYDSVMSMDLKGMLPMFLVNQGMGRVMLADMENYRKHVMTMKNTDL